jgi:phosphoribosyl 1,2-cyclic phosphate phosphodiesterase
VTVESGKPFTVGDLEVIPVDVPHGNITVFGYRIGPLAYVTDAKSLPPETIRQLKGASVLVESEGELFEVVRAFARKHQPGRGM